MLVIPAGTLKLVIVLRSEIGQYGKLYALRSENEIRSRLIQACQDAGVRILLRNYCGKQGITNLSEANLPDRVAQLSAYGPLAVFLVPDTSVRRITGILQQSEAPQLVSGPNAVSIEGPTIWQRLERQLGMRGPPASVAKLTILQRLERVVPRAVQSDRLSAEAKTQLKGMLSDPVQQTLLLSSLALWLASHLIGVGEILDILLICAAAAMAGVGIAFTFKAIIDGAHLMSEFATSVRKAQTEEDLDNAADILTLVIVTIGIIALMAALTHAISKAVGSEGMKPKGTRMSEAGKAVQDELRASSQRAAERKPAQPPTEVTPPRPRTGKILSNIQRKGTDAFKRDVFGNIKAEKRSSPFGAGHGGAPGEKFVLEEYALELKDGSKITAYKSKGRIDPATGKIVPDARMDSDCHGVTFTDGEYWIDNDQVDKMLAGGGYNKTTTAKPGDVLVYRDENGEVVHSVTVTEVDKNGKPAKVSGLGGIEMKEHSDPPDKGWYDPNAQQEVWSK